MKRLLVFTSAVLAVTASVVPSGAAVAAHASANTSLGVAAAPGAVDASGATADVLMVAYHGPIGTEVYVTVCRLLSCANHHATASDGSLTVAGAGYRVQADLPGLGSIDVRFGPGEGNQTTYECAAATAGTFALAGADVEASSVQGTLGPWTLENRTCAAWGKDAAMQWNTL